MSYEYYKKWIRERFIKKIEKKLIKISFRYVRVAEIFEKIVFFLPIFPLFFPRHIGKKKEKKNKFLMDVGTCKGKTTGCL